MKELVLWIFILQMDRVFDKCNVPRLLVYMNPQGKLLTYSKGFDTTKMDLDAGLGELHIILLYFRMFNVN